MAPAADQHEWRELGSVVRRRGVSDGQLVTEILTSHGLADLHPNDVKWSVVCLRDDAGTSTLRVEVRTTPTPPRLRAKPRHRERGDAQ